MKRKCLHNKKKETHKNGSKHGRVGLLLNIHDASGTELAVGDRIDYKGYKCRILYGAHNGKYRAYIADPKYIKGYGIGYVDRYNPAIYFDDYDLPMDDGARMQIVKLEETNERD